MMKHQWLIVAKLVFFFCVSGIGGLFEKVIVNEENTEDQIVDAQFARDGNIITISRKGEYRKWAIRGHFSKDLGIVQPSHIYVSDDREFSFSFGEDFSIQVHKLGKNKFTLTGHNAPILAVSYQSFRNQIISYDADSKIKIWSAQNGQLLASFNWRTTEEPMSASWSPDQKYMLIVTKNHRFFAMQLPKISTQKKGKWLNETKLGFCFFIELFWPLWLHSNL